VQPTTAPIPSGTKRNWWTRNWKWFVPVGCLTIILVFIAFVGSMVVIVFSAIKSTDLYKDPPARAKTHPAVIEALGSPIREGFLVSGNTNPPHPGKGTCPFPSLVLKETALFTSRRRNRWAAGTIRDSSWKSKKRIKESISSEARRRQINADHSIATRRQELSVNAILHGIFGGLVGVVI